MINKETLIRQLTDLGICKGDIVHVKVSLKSIGRIEGGADTLIEALLAVIGEQGCLVCDSFVGSQIELFRHFKKKIFDKNSVSYAGAFVNAAIKYPGAFRSSHPIQAFTAIGGIAKELTEQFTKDSLPYEFLEKLVALGAKNLRIGPNKKIVGVGTTHVVICRLGFWQKQIVKGIYYREADGELKWFRQNWADGCAAGFKQLMPFYYEGGAVIAQGAVGETDALLTDMQKTLDIEYQLFKKEPTAFMCGRKDCVYCSFTWANSKYSFVDCFWANIKKKEYKKAMQALAIQVLGKKLK